jgi:hypothetical protein
VFGAFPWPGFFHLVVFLFYDSTDPSLPTVRASLLVALLVVRVPPWPAEMASPLIRPSVSRPPGLYARRATTLDSAIEAMAG